MKRWYPSNSDEQAEYERELELIDKRRAEDELDPFLWYMSVLAANLTIAGALCASFRAGDNFGFHMGSDESQCGCQWAPGRGEPYKGATRCEQDEIYEPWRDERPFGDEDEP